MVDPVLTGVCLSGLSGFVRGCVGTFGANGTEIHGPRCGEITDHGSGHMGGLGGRASKLGGRMLHGRVTVLRHRVRRLPTALSVSRGFGHVECMHCTSSFLVYMVKDGGSYMATGKSVGAFLRSVLGLRLSSRGALVAGSRSATGFLNFSIAIHDASGAEGSFEKVPVHSLSRGIILLLPCRMVEGGLVSCGTVHVVVEGNGRM